MFLPHFAAVAVDGVDLDGDLVTFRVRAKAGEAPCLGCRWRSGRVHARYQRQLADIPLGGRRVRVVVCVRRFKCVNPECSQSTFSEQIEGLTTPFARRTPPLTQALVRVALALAGRPGARLAARLAMPCCHDVLIGLIRAQPLPEAGRIEVLGVDDFAVRRRRSYNTILINMDNHRPVDVLPDREAGTLAAWLREHPEIRTVCRDRAGAYAEGIRSGAPQAIQVADRFHLWKNLCEAVEKTVSAHHPCLRKAAAAQAIPGEPEPSTPAPAPAAELIAAPQRSYRLAERTRERYTAVQQCLARGLSRSAISRELNLDRQTVRRFANATCVEELLGRAEHRLTKLDPYIDLVNRRWNEGVTNAQTITCELRTLGFTGDVQTVRRYLKPFRMPGTSRCRPDPHRRRPTPTAAAVPKPRKISRALLTHPDRLTEQDALIVKNATTECVHLEHLQQHVRTFAKIMTQRRGLELPAWLDAVEADDLPELHSLAIGMRRDLTAIINGLTTEHSSGAVEGNVTRVKRLKRDGYGRANFDLLRAQILLAA
ncbi:ISL3 family transposase [Nocardia sp. CA-120079]|uniref:ISL3 family transposase n=1 Tax=Nocardia sp. CA-120079 TaxID=3239974 RepID=UPI003D99ADEF